MLDRQEFTRVTHPKGEEGPMEEQFTAKLIDCERAADLVRQTRTPPTIAGSHSVAHRSLCHGGTTANGGCRHCRHWEVEVRKTEETLNRGDLTEILNLLDSLCHPKTITLAIRKLVGADLQIGHAAEARTIGFLRKHWKCVVALEERVIQASPAASATILAFPELASELPQEVRDGARRETWAISAAMWATGHDAREQDLSGYTLKSALEPEDIFLAACYWDNQEASRSLESRRDSADWTWEKVQECLSKNSRPDQGEAALGDAAESDDGYVSRGEGRDQHGHNLRNKLENNFAVRALQPRMAELAFPAVYQQIEHVAKADLVDLNRAALQAQQTWQLAARLRLPADDWHVRSRDLRVDVKCNLYFRSYAGKQGLRGFCIDIGKENPDGCMAGFVFYDSDDWGACWSFIGFLRPREVNSVLSDSRVAPFWFKMPDSLRFSVLPGDLDIAKTAELIALVDQLSQGPVSTKCQPRPAHPRWPAILGWADKLKASEIERFPRDPRVAIEFVANAFRSSGAEKPPMERALWQAATDAVVKLRSKGTPKSNVDDLLTVFEQIYASPWLPVHLANVKSETLLHRWSRDVLRELNANWIRIACPDCGGKQVNVEPNTLSGSGALNGHLRCDSCGFSESVTLITHCWGCEHYPLVIGKNKICKKCNGLRCNWDACGKCKRECRFAP